LEDDCFPSESVMIPKSAIQAEEMVPKFGRRSLGLDDLLISISPALPAAILPFPVLASVNPHMFMTWCSSGFPWQSELQALRQYSHSD